MVRTTVQGNYPKISSNRDDPNLRATLNRLDSGKAAPEDVEVVIQQTIQRVVREQEQAGIDLITDGQIRWSDLVTPLAKEIDGFEIGGLIRFFDNNTYYRRPIVKGALKWTGPILARQWQAASAIASKPVKQVIPGPYTFATLSLDEHYGDKAKLTNALADILAEEVRALDAAGCREIQIDEPSVCYADGEIDMARRALDTVLDVTSATKTLWFYFGRMTAPLTRFLDADVTRIGVDVVSWPENWEAVRNTKFPGEVCLGCFDARNTKIEDPSAIAKMIDAVSANGVWIAPNAGLEFLPHDRALRKLNAITATAAKYNGGSR